MSTITPDHLRDLANIQHARSCGETPLQDTPAWQAAERIEALETKLASAEARLGQITGAVRRVRIFAGNNLPAGTGCNVVHMLEQALKEGIMTTCDCDLSGRQPPRGITAKEAPRHG